MEKVNQLNVLIIGKDQTIFETGNAVFGDTRTRHIEYARELRKRVPGSTVHIISYTQASKSYKEESVGEGLILHPTNSIHRATYLIGVLRIFIKTARNWRPDLVTVQTPYEEGSLGLILSRLTKAKYLPQVHFDFLSAEWLNESLLNRWRKWVSSWVVRHSDGVRVVSETLKKKMINQLNISEKKITVIPVSVNYTPIIAQSGRRSYKEQLCEFLSDKPVVLFVGRLVEQKNLKLWVDVASGVSKEVSDSHFVIAGDGVLSDAIKDYAREKNLSDKIHFLGNVGYSILPQIYAAGDIFLLTSNYEGFGRVIVEAYYSGLPVVSTKSTGPEDIVVDGETGYLHEKGDLAGLTGSIVRLLKDKELADGMAKKGLQKVENEYSKEVLITKLIDCWIKLIGTK